MNLVEYGMEGGYKVFWAMVKVVLVMGDVGIVVI